MKIVHIPTGNEDSNIEIPSPFIKNPSFMWTIFGASGSGKSNMIRNLLINNHFLASVFDRTHIFLFCPTSKLNCDFADIIPFENTFDGYQEAIVKQILSEQEDHITMYGRKYTPNVLLIFDDLAYSGKLHNDKSLINKLAFNGRHYKVSTIVSSQALKMVSPKTRTNAHMITFFGSTNNHEIDAFCEEFIPKRYRKSIADQMFDHSQIPFSFIHFCKNNKHNERFIKNLDEPFKI
jgi:hypothetical protein